MSDDKHVEKICVLGLGYIGLPTASMFASHGFKVLGVDTNPVVVNLLSQGRIHIEEPGLATVVKAAINSKNLEITTKPQAADVFIIAVPTPHVHDPSGVRADMSFVRAALESVISVLRSGNLVILESTSPPGTICDIVVPALKAAGFKPGVDVGVAYCPERVIPGQALKELIGNDRVVGAIGTEWAQEVRKLYKTFVSGEISITEPTVAEMVKLVENTFRDVNIALANEVALICEKLQINVWDVIQIANRHPRVNIHRPGPGVGGHCISVDPWFLVEKFPQEANLVRLARNVNDGVPARIVERVRQLVQGKSKAKIAVMGLAYKGNVDDDRESPAVNIIRLMKSAYPSWAIAIYEPHVKSREFQTQGIQEVFSGAHLGLLLTPHDEYRFLDPQQIGELMADRVIFDTHNFLKQDRWVQCGFKFIVHGVGEKQA